MSAGHQHIKDCALEAATGWLRRALPFAKLHKPEPLFSKVMGKGNDAVLVRIEWPGILCVYDLSTGLLLARSKPGDMQALEDSFESETVKAVYGDR